MSVVAIGGKGGNGFGHGLNPLESNGGYGAVVTANNVAVTGGTSLAIQVAGNGGSGVGRTGGAGGTGGGGAGGSGTSTPSSTGGAGGGGGASSVYASSTALVVSAGGGGAGGRGPSGDGGPAGSPGFNGFNGVCTGGGAGVGLTPGAGGFTSFCPGGPGSSGSGSTAGAGGSSSVGAGGGGGGGGYGGGGGGQASDANDAAGGGGGSSFPASATITADSIGTPSVKISWSLPGEGTMSANMSVVSAGQTGRTITFTYTAANTMTNGVVRVTVPTGWSAPSLTSTAAGRSTVSTGTVSISSRTIVVSGLNMSNGNTLSIVYGSKTSGGPGATATTTTGAQGWTSEQQTTNSTGSPTALAASPSITVYAKDGSGTNTTPTTTAKSNTFKTIVFTYTAAAGGMVNGSVTLKVPTGWTAPTLTSSANGYVQASAGTVSISGRVITVSNLTLSGGATLTITFGSTAGGGAGGKAPLTAVGLQAWKTKEKSTSAGTLTALTVSPKIKVTS